MLLPNCTNNCGTRTYTGGICKNCLRDLNHEIFTIDSVATRYIVLTASTQKLAEELLRWWFS